MPRGLKGVTFTNCQFGFVSTSKFLKVKSYSLYGI